MTVISWKACLLSFQLVGLCTNKTIVGIFDSEEEARFFEQVLGNYAQSSYYIIMTDNLNSDMFVEELCENQLPISYFYVMSSNSIIQLVMIIAQTLNVPMFVYDTNLDGNYNQLDWRGDLLFYMNSQPGLEGQALAEVITASNWRHVYVVSQRELQYDGLVDSFTTQYINVNHGTVNVLVHSKQSTVSSLLISLHQTVNSVSESYSPYDIILLHTFPDVIDEVIKSVNLLFYDRKMVWLVTSACQPKSLTETIPNMVTLTPSIDQDFIEDTIELIQHSFDTVQHQFPLDENSTSNNSCFSDPFINYHWLNSLMTTGLVKSGLITYYKYSIQSTQVTNVWQTVSTIDSIHHLKLPTVAQALDNEALKNEKGTCVIKNHYTYTIVTILDKPFVSEVYPTEMDNIRYCQTPAVRCLKISQETISSNSFSSQIVRDIYEDFYTGAQHHRRAYELTCCEGLSIDVLQSLSSELGFEFQMYLVPDGKFGAYDASIGNWTGMVKELLDGRADIVMASFSITSPRSAVIDYSAPYYYSGFTLLSIERDSEAHKYFVFIQPFPDAVWLMLMLGAIVASLLISFTEWRSPYGSNPMHKADLESYTLSSGIKTTISLVCGNTLPCKSPKALSTKIIQTSWAGFAIMCLSVYTANLTSSIADRKAVIDVSGIYDEQLLDLNVAGTTNAAAENFVKIVNPALYQNMKQFKIAGTTEGAQALRDGTLDVYVHDTPVIEYIASQENFDCRLTKLGAFAVDSYGAGFPRDALPDLRDAVSAKFLEYQVSGYIDKLRNVYFPVSSTCVEQSGQTGIELTLDHSAGLFFILAGAIVFCFLAIGAEHIVYKWLIPYIKRRPVNSCWRSVCLMFISQRLYRAVVKDGGKGSSVFKAFAQKAARGAQSLSLERLSFQRREAIPRVTFYDIVSEAYQRKYNKPLESILVAKRSPNVKKSLIKTRGLNMGMNLRNIAMATGGLGIVLKQEKQYSDMLEAAVQAQKAGNQSNLQTDLEADDGNTEFNKFNIEDGLRNATRSSLTPSCVGLKKPDIVISL